jgi:hypothetical protein
VSVYSHSQRATESPIIAPQERTQKGFSPESLQIFPGSLAFITSCSIGRAEKRRREEEAKEGGERIFVFVD